MTYMMFDVLLGQNIRPNMHFFLSLNYLRLLLVAESRARMDIPYLKLQLLRCFVIGC